MGLDLAISPLSSGTYADAINFWHLAYQRLEFNRDYSVFAQIAGSDFSRDHTPPAQVCKPKPVPSTVSVRWYEDEGLTARTTDPYGSALTYVTAGELAKVDVADAGRQTQAVMAFVRALEPDTPILLWWH